jgi:hypothetical protein
MTTTRDRDPILADCSSWRYGRPWGDPVDLIQILQRQASALEGDDLSAGMAIPGAPGACAGCAHAKVWHRHSRRECEKCDCPKLVAA